MRKTLLIALIITVIAFLVAVEGFGQGKKIVIGHVPITLSHAVHGNAAKWAKIYAKDKYKADFVVIDPDNDLQRQIKAVEDMIAKGVTGIVLSAVVESGVNEVIQEARKAGIYVVTYIIDGTDQKTPFVRINEIQATTKLGVNMTKKWKELYPNIPVKVGFVDFLKMEYTKINRSGPFLKGVQSVDPSVKGPVFQLGAEGVQDEAKKIGQAVLQSHPEVNIVYGTNTPNAIGALTAFEEAGRGKAVDGTPLTEIFAGTDGDVPELLKLADPTSSFKYTQGMQPQIFAYAYIDTMMKVIKGEIAPDQHSEVDAYNIYLDYYTMKVKDYQDWFNTQYMPANKLDIAAELAKKGIKVQK
jgi:ABC-type sugar transport system substrate-binding protein